MGITMKKLKGLGTVVFCLTPFIVSFIIQNMVSFIAYAIILWDVQLQNMREGILETSIIKERVIEVYYQNVGIVLFAYHVIGLLIFGVWYYFGFYKNKKTVGQSMKNKDIVFLGIFSIGFQLLISGILSMLLEWKPEWMNNYMELMDKAGFSSLEFFSMIAAVFIAPVGEELIFRGITMEMAKKRGEKFWAANIIQAMAFGLCHLNVVQGIYAFVLGLAIGYIKEAYGHIKACILFHFLFNFLGTVVLGNIPDMGRWNLIIYFAFTLLGAAITLCVAGYFKELKRRNKGVGVTI